MVPLSVLDSLNGNKRIAAKITQVFTHIFRIIISTTQFIVSVSGLNNDIAEANYKTKKLSADRGSYTINMRTCHCSLRAPSATLNAMLKLL